MKVSAVNISLILPGQQPAELLCSFAVPKTEDKTVEIVVENILIETGIVVELDRVPLRDTLNHRWYIARNADRRVNNDVAWVTMTVEMEP